jgi:hypothetical protein
MERKYVVILNPEHQFGHGDLGLIDPQIVQSHQEFYRRVLENEQKVRKRTRGDPLAACRMKGIETPLSVQRSGGNLLIDQYHFEEGDSPILRWDHEIETGVKSKFPDKFCYSLAIQRGSNFETVELGSMQREEVLSGIEQICEEHGVTNFDIERVEQQFFYLSNFDELYLRPGHLINQLPPDMLMVDEKIVEELKGMQLQEKPHYRKIPPGGRYLS